MSRSRTVSRQLRHAPLVAAATLAACLSVVAPASALELSVNFQPGSAPTVPAYHAETGLPYSGSRGYGFVREDSLGGSRVGLDLTAQARDRNVIADQRRDTHIQIDGAEHPAGAWEASLPNGKYIVTVTAGDGDRTQVDNARHRVNAEGRLLLSFAASTDASSLTRSLTLDVTDGRLTLDGIGGTHTKLQYVDIETAPSAPISRKFNFGTGSTPAVTGYTKDTGEGFADARGYGWVSEASLSSPTHAPVSLVGNGRDRTASGVSDARVSSLLHMQYAGATPAAWELKVPNGSYDVTVGVGDALATALDSTHDLNIEGSSAVRDFTPSADSRFRFGTRTVSVNDGRLTLDAIGGTNTKLLYVTVDSAPTGATRPSVGDVQPPDGATLVTRGRAITTEVTLPNVGAGVVEATLTPDTAYLERVSDGAKVPGDPTTSAGGDVIVLQPDVVLAKNTQYRFTVTSAVKDRSGARFEPTTTTFTTNSSDPGTSTVASFTRTAQSTSEGELSASLAMGPDNKLYATTLSGKILRFPVNGDGSLGEPLVINTVVNAEGEPRHILGLAFDPASTASTPILWVSHSYAAELGSPDWAGKISRLSGTNLGTIKDYVVNLPRSVRDHETNSLAFGPDGVLYAVQGSNTATGGVDTQWGERPEAPLTAAVLRVDTDAITAPPLNVHTAPAAPAVAYDPFKAGAPVTVYASGVRNAYDLVWHSNGQLYVPTNGSAANGNTPATPGTLPAACGKRLDFATNGAWTGPSVPAIRGLDVQPDLLFRAVKGGYYGHPNPSRCEYAFMGGNPTSGVDAQELTRYPVGTQPDRNFRRASWSFGDHFSPNGVVEYKSNAFGGALRGKLLVARFSGGKDIVALTIDAATKEIVDQEDGIPGLGGLASPLDVTEDTRNGNLYVTELYGARISLLKPKEAAAGGAGTGQIAVSNADGAPFDDRLVFNRIGSLDAPPSNGVHDRGTVQVRNTGSGPLQITGLPISGPFQVVDAPALPATVAPGESLDVKIRFVATGGRLSTGALTVQSDSQATPTKGVFLTGFWQYMSENGTEPNLYEIVNNLYGYQTQLSYSGQQLNNDGRLEAVGQEVVSPFWRRADTSQGVNVTQLAAFHSQGATAQLAWYLKGGDQPKTALVHAGIDGQSLLPHKDGSTTELATATFFPPAQFGFKLDNEWSEPNRNNKTADYRDGCTDPCGHRVRFWPLRDRSNVVVPNTYLVAMDYANPAGSNFDYNDNVYLVSNITPDTASATEQVLYRIDTGTTSNYTDTQGRLWTADRSMNPLPFTPSTAKDEGTATSAIANTLDDRLYATYRGNVGNVPVSDRILDYHLPTGTATRVDVRLHFAERAQTAGGLRRFDVIAEDVLKINDLDLFARAGGKDVAWTEAINNIPIDEDDALDLRFVTEIDYASIAGIEVICRAGCS